MKHICIPLFTLICCLGLSSKLYAQPQDAQIEFEKNIRVFSEPQVQLSDVVRLSVRPNVHDTVQIPLELRYSIQSEPIATAYEVRTLRAVTVTGDRLPELHRGQISFGVGNYAKTFADVHYMSERSRQQQAGIQIYHTASAGKITLENDERVNAGYSENYIHAYGKLFKDKITLYGSFRPQFNTVRLYGYETDTILYPDVVMYDTTLAKEHTQRRFFSIHTQGGVSSRTADPRRYRFDQRISHDFFMVNPTRTENVLALSSDGKQQFDLVNAGYDANFRWSARNFIAHDSLFLHHFSQLTVLPYIGASIDNWNLQAGIQLSQFWAKEHSFKAYPDIQFNYNLHNNRIIPYITYNGRYETYSMKDMYALNPYASDTIMLQPTHYSSIIDIGIKGRALRNMPFNGGIRFTKAEDMHFWIHDVPGTDTAQNTFIAVYDDASVFTAFLQTGIKRRVFNMHLDFAYNSYSLENLEKAWHKPGIEATYGITYNIVHPRTNRNKLVLRTEVFYEDLRYSFNGITGEKNERMSPLFDCNLGIDYYYSSVLIAFLDFKNLTATQYERFEKYPNHRFHVMAGVTYSFSGLRK